MAVLAIAVAALLWLWLHQTRKGQSHPVAVATPVPTATTAVTQQVHSTPVPGQPPPRATQTIITQEREREKKTWDLWLATPISFYGKVIDEKGNPVSGANVSLSFADSLGSNDTKREETTDTHGLFHVSGHGLGIVVMVSKEGYYQLKGSDGRFAYSKSTGQIDPHSDADNAAVFVLRKIGKIEPLIVKGIGGSLAKNGTPTEIDLRSGQKVPAGQGDISIECWTNDQGIGPNSNDHFDWRCRVSVDGGGLVDRTGEFDFEAPDSGYSQSAEVDMPKTAGEKWRSSLSEEYFVHLRDGTYARVRFMMNAGGEQTFALTSYLNPQSGSRNLEYGQQRPGTPP